LVHRQARHPVPILLTTALGSIVGEARRSLDTRSKALPELHPGGDDALELRVRHGAEHS
jgi:hypothetical protein